jgi:tetratricopeptide (TPR) repeat protein
MALMRFTKTRSAAILIAGLLGWGGCLPRGVAQQSSPQTQTPPASDENSFPSDISRKAAAEKKKAEQQTDKSSPDAPRPDSENPDPAKPPAAPGADDNAFPEDASRKAAAAAKADAAKDARESSSSDSESSNSGVSSSSDYDRSTAGRTAVPANVPMPHVNGKDPVKEDLNVGGYYLESGNFAGAYLRFKDATTLAPENMDAIFGLAEAARHLKRRDEALANYQMFLQVVSSGSKAKDARKAVASLEKAK